MEVEACKIVDEWRVEEQAIEAIEYAAVAGKYVGGVFCACAAFECAFGEVAENSQDSHDCGEGQHVFEWKLAEEPEVRERGHGKRGDDSTDCAFPSLAGTD